MRSLANGPNTERRHPLGRSQPGARQRTGRTAPGTDPQPGHFQRPLRHGHRHGHHQPTQKDGFPLTLELSSSALPKKSWVKISQIRTPAVERIGKKLAEASPEELALVVEGLGEIVG